MILSVASFSEASPVIGETGYGLTGLGGLGLLGHGPILTLGHAPALVAPKAVDYYVSLLLILLLLARLVITVDSASLLSDASQQSQPNVVSPTPLFPS